MRNAGLNEAQAGIKIAGRNINNLRYADDTTLMAEHKEELKNLLMKVKEEREKVGWKFNIQKTKILVSGPITSWQIDGETVETLADFFLDGRGVWGKKDTCVCMAESLCCPPEIITTFLIGYTPIQSKKLIEKNTFNSWYIKIQQIVQNCWLCFSCKSMSQQDSLGNINFLKQLRVKVQEMPLLYHWLTTVLSCRWLK